MILFIVKPERGFGFAAILNPGWVDGETGVNEKGITVSQNNIGIKQDDWNVTPIMNYMEQGTDPIHRFSLLLIDDFNTNVRRARGRSIIQITIRWRWTGQGWRLPQPLSPLCLGTAGA